MGQQAYILTTGHVYSVQNLRHGLQNRFDRLLFKQQQLGWHTDKQYRDYENYIHGKNRMIRTVSKEDLSKELWKNIAEARREEKKKDKEGTQSNQKDKEENNENKRRRKKKHSKKS